MGHIYKNLKNGIIFSVLDSQIKLFESINLFPTF